MERRKFLYRTCICTLAGLAMNKALQSCALIKYSAGTIKNSDLLIPLEDFIDRTGKNVQYRKYVIASNDLLKFPVCIYRFSDTEYKALWTECTHQGNELQVFGEKLECPAHGSEFDTRGQVLGGPCRQAIKKFPCED